MIKHNDTILLRLPSKLKKAVRIEAEAQDLSISAYVRKALKNLLLDV